MHSASDHEDPAEGFDLSSRTVIWAAIVGGLIGVAIGLLITVLIYGNQAAYYPPRLLDVVTEGFVICLLIGGCSSLLGLCVGVSLEDQRRRRAQESELLPQDSHR